VNLPDHSNPPQIELLFSVHPCIIFLLTCKSGISAHGPQVPAASGSHEERHVALSSFEELKHVVPTYEEESSFTSNTLAAS